MATLTIFGIAAPLLGALGERDRFLLDNGIAWSGVAELLALLMIVLPVVAVTMDWLIGRISRGRLAWLRQLVPACLLLLLTLRLVQLPLRYKWMWQTNATVQPLLGAAVAMAVLGAWLYGRSKLAQQWCTVTSVAVVIFPATFLMKFAAMQPEPPPAVPPTPIENPVPVVVIVFDEFSGTSLMNDKLEIDAERFPQFARLAGLSTWYRNATTVHERTNVALPAILTGRYPAQAQIESTPANYPDNLFTWLAATQQYDAVVFEPVSRLCDPALFGVENRPASGQIHCLVQTLASVYPHLLVPRCGIYDHPEIPKTWFGFAETRRTDPEDRRGVIRYGWDRDHGAQADHFLECLTPGEQPLFAFFHFVAPHCPWRYLPSGNHYTGELLGCPDDEVWPKEPRTSRQGWQRHLLQVGYVDHVLGRILDRLEEERLLDECLLIVMADHGVSFGPGQSRREASGESLSEILSIPLFVKRPHQRTGGTSERNVQSTDILPTIADVLQAPLPGPVDGSSLLADSGSVPPRKRAWLMGYDTVLEPILPGRQRAIERRMALLGTGDMTLTLQDIGPHPEWQGTQLAGEIAEADPGTLRASLDAFGPQTTRRGGEFVPAFLRGKIEGTGKDRSAERELLCTMNGTVVGSTWSFPYNDAERWEFMLPESLARAPEGPVELFAIGKGERPRFRRLLKFDLNRHLTESALQTLTP